MFTTSEQIILNLQQSAKDAIKELQAKEIKDSIVSEVRGGQ